MKTIGIKIGAGYLLAVVLLVVIGTASFSSIDKLRENIAWVNHTHEVLQQLEMMQRHMIDIETGARGFVITGDEQYLTPYHSGIDKVGGDIRALRTLTSDNPLQQANIANLEPLVAESLAVLAKIVGSRKGGDFAGAQAMVKDNSGKTVMDKIRQVVTEMTNTETGLLASRSEEEELAVRNFKLVIVWGMGLATLVLAVACYLITGNIARPLARLTAVATAISQEGDLSARAEITDRGDEVGALARAFFRMTDYLATMADAARRIAANDLTGSVAPLSEKDALGTSFAAMLESLRRQVTEIGNSAKALRAASREISTTTAQLSANASETSTSVSQTTASAEETRKIVGMVSEKTADIARHAEQMAEVADAGKDSTEETVAAIRRIQEQMSLIADSIVSLSDQTQAIGEIITTVEELSEQSNLLAVNAAIEAAKVGDQGKGFAVVAQEIKNMAEQSKEATGRVRTILTDIQKAATASVMVTEQGAKAVAAGSKQSTKAGEAIASLADSLMQSALAANQILAAAQQQSTGMDQIVQAMKNIDTASSQNVAGAKQLQEMVRNLDTMGASLATAAEQYTV